MTAISYGLDAVEREPGEPQINPNFSAWWKWTAPANGYGVVSLAGSELGRYYDWTLDRSLLVYRVDSFSEMIVATPIAVSTSDYYLPADLTFEAVANEDYYIVAGGGRLTQYGFRSGGDADSTPWKVLTVQYSATSPAVQAAKAAINAQIAATKKAMKRAKTAKAKKALRKRLASLQRQLRAL